MIVVYSDLVGLSDRLTDLAGKDFIERGSFEGICHAVFDAELVKITKLEFNDPSSMRLYLPTIKHALVDQLRKGPDGAHAIHWDPAILKDFQVLRYLRNAGMAGDNASRIYEITKNEMDVTPPIPLDFI